MTVTAGEKYDAETSAEDFMAAEEPPEVEEEAPFGWTRDRSTGELRPRKMPGRPKKQPVPGDMPAGAEPVSRAEDKPPAAPSKSRPGPAGAPAMPRGGVIAAGVNKLYKRAGKIYRAFDHDVGTALIEITRPDPEDPDTPTVGEAWERLCKSNPRIRAWVMRAITTGDVGELIAVHLPVAIAFVMKPWVQRLIPVGRLVESVAEPDEDTPEGEGGLPGGMTADDFGQMRDLAKEQARKMAERMGMTVTEEQMAEATAAATKRFGAAQIPPGLRRQPQRRSRAERRG